MLKFFNKKGKKVMESKDNGELNIISKELKETFNKVDEEEKAEKEEDKDEWN